jgi:aspartyl-tRNA(Asn)/glutamyl-tRNA(Gln) amidotransferase subunit A
VLSSLQTSITNESKKIDSDVHAFLYLDKEGALSQAADVDAKRASGQSLHPLAGVPLALKDVMTQKGIPTTCGFQDVGELASSI